MSLSTRGETNAGWRFDTSGTQAYNREGKLDISRQSLAALAAKQPRFHFWLLTSLGVAVFATSFLSHDKRGLLYYDEPSALLAEDLNMMPQFASGGYGVGRGGGERGNPLRRTISRRGAAPGTALTSQTPGGAGGFAGEPTVAPATQNFGEAPVTTLTSGPSTSGTQLGLPGFSTGGFNPSPIVLVIVPSEPGPGPGPGDGGSDPVIPAVPEPASWLMMIIAVFALGTAIRHSHAERAQLAAC